MAGSTAPPVLAFDCVSLAFDENVVLRDVSVRVDAGAIRINGERTDDPITARPVDDQIIKPRDLEHVTSIVVTHQLRDAFYIATHHAVRENGAVRIVPASPSKAEEAEFVILKDGPDPLRRLGRGTSGLAGPVHPEVPVLGRGTLGHQTGEEAEVISGLDDGLRALACGAAG